MVEVKDYFEIFICNMMKPALEKFERTDAEYQEVLSFLEVNRNQYEQIMDSLGRKEREFIQVYIDKKSICDSCSNQAMYIAGYRNCIKLLKEMEIF